MSTLDDPGDRSRAVREGLPQGYRMRADAHYVDQLEARHEARVIRLIPIENIETVETGGTIGKALAASIRAHGILQPLLVRKHKTGYRVIAGHRRLAAATQAGLRDVPCLVCDAEEAQTVALAEEDDSREPPTLDSAPVVAATIEHLRGVLRAVCAEIAPLNASASLLRRSGNRSLQQKVAADLIVAQAWRASWLANATAVGLGDPVRSRPRPLQSVLDTVKSGFDAESRVSALQLKVTVAPEAATIPVDEDLGVLALSGGIIATIALLQNVDEPQIELHADVPNARTLKIEIVQRLVPLTAERLDCFRGTSVAGSGDLMTSLGLQAMRAFAAEHGGTFEASAMNGRGSLIQVTVSRR